MQFTLRNTMGIVLLVATVTGGYLLYHDSTTPSGSLHVASSSLSGADSVSIRKPGTVASSGTQWDMSPFGSGKPLTEEDTHKVVFKKPNTEWKSRTINDITYRFGEGNPQEVSLSKDGIQKYMQTVDPITGGAPYGYMTSASELAMKTFLENPSLSYFIEKCHIELDWNHTRRPDMQEWEKYPHDFSMEKLLQINTTTKMKEWDWNSISQIDTVFNNLDSPISSAWKSCLTDDEYKIHLKPLHEQFSNVLRTYMVHE